MTFQSLSRQFFGNPAAIFLRRLILYSLELYLLLILITKSAFLMSISFDGFFTGLIESFFRAIFDNVLSENVSEFITNNDVLAEKKSVVENPSIWSYIGNYFSIFYSNLKAEPNPLLKITMIFKSLVLFSFVSLMIYHIFLQSMKALKYKWFILLILKVIVVTLFLLTGAATYLALIDSGNFLNYGTLFSFNMVRSCFAEQKLLILFIFLTAARDVILHAVSIIKK